MFSKVQRLNRQSWFSIEAQDSPVADVSSEVFYAIEGTLPVGNYSSLDILIPVVCAFNTHSEGRIMVLDT
ncbi:MAG: hypothetical protein AAB286_00110, partial [Pseudomonadota bacterium]